MILLAAAAMCLAPGCSVKFPERYEGPRFPPGTECQPYRMIPQGMIIVCLVPVQQPVGEPYPGEGSLDAA